MSIRIDINTNMCRKPACLGEFIRDGAADLRQSIMRQAGSLARALGPLILQLFSLESLEAPANACRFKNRTLRPEPTPCRGPASGRSHQSTSTAAPVRDGSSTREPTVQALGVYIRPLKPRVFKMCFAMSAWERVFCYSCILYVVYCSI